VIVVLDTNVLVSGLLNPDRPPGMVLNLIARGDIKLAYDNRIINEYSDVLKREEFGFNEAVVDLWIKYIQVSGVPVVPAPLNLELPDSDDEKFVEVAAASGADCLITGNLKHYNARAKRFARIIRPRQFIIEYGRG
jgi:putative PIN family toxin of toxin-antitoxin system